jgi:D-alanyl-lipoteichoic acid acyltransferase DltB (MBOAT superfamily)
MLFNDYPFLLGFLPAAILLYRIADPHPRLRIGALVLLSFVFYSYWNPPFILLLALSIMINWLAVLAFARTKRRTILTAAIVFDLLVLGVFKYANFFAYNLGLVLDRPMPKLDIALPLGISFFTFHHIMYLADLRRGKAPFYSLGRYALYISFFPQAIAGPLARWSEVMHQFGRQVYAPGWQRQFCLGIAFITTGLFEKILLGDRVGRLLDPIYEQARLGMVPDGDSWLALSFGFQIFYDFAGYSDIAIGLGLLFGVQLPFNFNAPFRSTSIQDFWQRWHMTLMMFLRDYVFNPLANCPYRAAALFSCAVFRRDASDHGTVRTVAWRELDLRVVGNHAWLRAGALFAVAPPWSAAAVPARMGVDRHFRASDQRDIPCRNAGCRVACLSGPGHPAGSQPRAAPVADLCGRAVCVSGAGQSGHHRVVDATAAAGPRRFAGYRRAAVADRVGRPGRL